MSSSWMKSYVRSKAFYFLLTVFVVYALLVKSVPDFALRASSVSSSVYRPMKVFYSFFSIFPMTFIFLPAYELFAYSYKRRDQLPYIVVRYSSSDQFVSSLAKKSLWEAFFAATAMTGVILIFSIESIPQLLGKEILIGYGFSLLGFWMVDALTDIFSLLFPSHPYFPILLSVAINIGDYLSYLHWSIHSPIVYLFVRTGLESVGGRIWFLLYAIFSLLILLAVALLICRGRSFYHVENQ